MDTEDLFEELRGKSIKILEFIFQSTKGDTEKYITRNDIANKMEFSDTELNAALIYLDSKNFIKFDSFLGLMENCSIIYLGQDGIRELDALYKQKREYEKLLKNYQDMTAYVTTLEAKLKEKDLIETNNQGINAPQEWEGFYFRSKAEIKIAEALDRAGVLFYPNSKARLTKAQVRINKESDFLVFQAGKFGILEVDGREWHQTAADDHERDRLFKRYGIRVIERFDATRCWNEPDKVVEEFLEILSHA